jgi:hypothetical protein
MKTFALSSGDSLKEWSRSQQSEEDTARAAPEIHMTDIVLPNQTNNENEYNSTSDPANPDFVK